MYSLVVPSRSRLDSLLHHPIPGAQLRAQAQPPEALVVCQRGQQHPVVHVRQSLLESRGRCLREESDFQNHHQGSQCTDEQRHWRSLDACACAAWLPGLIW